MMMNVNIIFSILIALGTIWQSDARRFPGSDDVGKGIYSQKQIDLGKDKIDFDMIIEIPTEEEIGKRKRRGVITNGLLKWPNSIVPYQFNTGEAPVSANVKQSTLLAMQQIMEKTCINFVERTDQKDYIVIQNIANQCYSYVGRRGGPQELNLANGCNSIGVAIHELLHALGFLHEHNRPDRDDYVTVKFENIQSGAETSFRKFQLTDYGGVSLADIAYDRQSVMHYSNFAFSKYNVFTPENMTIISKGNLGAAEQLGNGALSEKDIQRVRSRYSCSAASTVSPTTAMTEEPASTMEPKNTDEPSTVLTEKPEGSTEQPASTMEPENTDEPSTVLTEKPEGSTKQPASTMEPENTDEPSTILTKRPGGSTEQPVTPCPTKRPWNKKKKLLKKKVYWKKKWLKKWWKKGKQWVKGRRGKSRRKWENVQKRRKPRFWGKKKTYGGR